ncbi:MAG: hypothetical protein V3T70_05175 [Phycisphaerae bacterium]
MRALCLTVSVAVLSLAGGCIQVWTDPAIQLVIRVRDPDGGAVSEFVFLRMTRSERTHGYEDPPKHKHWLDPQITHLVYSDQGAASFHEPATVRLKGFILIPFVAGVSHTDVMYHVFARDAEVWIGVAGGKVRWDESSPTRHEATFYLRAERNRSGDDNLGEYYHRHPFSVSGANGIGQDLTEAWFWNDLKQRVRSGQDVEAIRFLCEYYLSRIASIQAENPEWSPPPAAQTTIEWMRSVRGSDAGDNQPSGSPTDGESALHCASSVGATAEPAAGMPLLIPSIAAEAKFAQAESAK